MIRVRGREVNRSAKRPPCVSGSTAWIVALILGALASDVDARTVRGLVFEDKNSDGRPTAGEPGVPAAVVALGVKQFVTTDGQGQFTFEVADEERALVWVRVPDGFVPGPVWAPVYG